MTVDSFTHINQVHLHKRMKQSIVYEFLIAIIWSFSMFSQYRGFITHIPIVGNLIAPFILSVIILLLMIATLHQTKKNFAPVDLSFIIIALGIFLLNYLLFPANEKMLDYYASPFILGTLPFYITGVVFDVDERTERIIYWTSVFDLFVLALYYLLYVQNVSYSGETEIMDDMMGPAYAALPFILVVIRKLFVKFDFLSLFLSIFGFLFLLSFGTRGPIACLLVFVLAYLLFLKKFKRPLLMIPLFVVVGFIIINNLNAILELLSPVMDKLGMGSRVIDYVQAMILYGAQEASDVSILERQEMINVAFENFAFLGHGIGSFPLISHSDHMYSHNIIVDFLIEYGSLFGPLMLIGVLWLFIKSLRITDTEAGKSFVLLLFCTSFVSLLFSLTYLIKPEFFFALGYYMHYIRKKSDKIESVNN